MIRNIQATLGRRPADDVLTELNWPLRSSKEIGNDLQRIASAPG